MRTSLFLATFALCGIVALTAHAQPNRLYGDSAGSNRIDVIDPATGALIRSCSPAKGNGRGMVVVGNNAYFTVAESNNVYRMDINTCADLGVAFSVTGAFGLSTIAYDGTNFWIGDYSGTNHAFYYSPTGTLLKTITLANCTGFCDGLEYFNGKLISNRGDAFNAPYDVYDTNGNLLQAAFITPNFSATGIAFDGTNFYVSNIFGASVSVFDGTTGAFIKNLPLTGGAGFLIEDLSFDYQLRPDTGGRQATGAPALGETALVILMVGLAGGGFFRLRRRGLQRHL
jgi:DNA-binding beta-propeller fold protein YncE